MFKIDPQGLAVVPLERDAPRAVDMDRIASRLALECMEVKPGLAQRFEPRRLVERR
jgi:hypothetical protein